MNSGLNDYRVLDLESNLRNQSIRTRMSKIRIGTPLLKYYVNVIMYFTPHY